MATATLTWHGDALLDRLNALMAQRLDRAARHVHNEIKKKISLAGTGSAIVSGYHDVLGGTGKTERQVYAKRKQRIAPWVRSQPGEPPRKQTGTLRRHVAYETDAASLTARVGVGGPPVAVGKAYALYLELGTSKMAPRPFIRTTMFEQAGNIARILEGRGSEEIVGIESGVNLEQALQNLGSIPLHVAEVPPSAQI